MKFHCKVDSLWQNRLVCRAKLWRFSLLESMRVQNFTCRPGKVLHRVKLVRVMVCFDRSCVWSVCECIPHLKVMALLATEAVQGHIGAEVERISLHRLHLDQTTNTFTLNNFTVLSCGPVLEQWVGVHVTRRSSCLQHSVLFMLQSVPLSPHSAWVGRDQDFFTTLKQDAAVYR